MTERERLGDAIKRIARGYILIHLNINLGTLNILPNWLGYILFYGALNVISEEEDSAKLLRPLAVLLGIWEALLWLLTLFGVSFDVPLITLFAEVIGLYFHFQLLTNLASIAKKYDCPEQKRLLTLRTVRTLLITLLSLPLPWEKIQLAGVLIVIIHVIVSIWITAVLYALRRSLIDKEQITFRSNTDEEV